jgi:hypothetical protein
MIKSRRRRWAWYVARKEKKLMPGSGWKGKKDKAISITGRGGPYGCETSRLPNFLDNRPTDGGEVVGFTCRPPFTPRKIPGIHFC